MKCHNETFECLNTMRKRHIDGTNFRVWASGSKESEIERQTSQFIVCT